jgi:hypothetical protein
VVANPDDGDPVLLLLLLDIEDAVARLLSDTRLQHGQHGICAATLQLCDGYYGHDMGER